MKPKSWWEETIGDAFGFVNSRLEIMKQLKFKATRPCPFGLLSPAEQEVMRECEVEYFTSLNIWIKIVKGDHLATHCTYRVRSDFKPEYEGETNTPAGEFVECEVYRAASNADTCDFVAYFKHPNHILPVRFSQREDIPGYAGYQVEGDMGWRFGPMLVDERGVAMRPEKVRFWKSAGGEK